jgi:hypothetical protein
MPTRRKGESEKDYLKRCIPIRNKEGKDKSIKQSVAICHSMAKEQFNDKITAVFKESANMATPTKEYPIPAALKNYKSKLGVINFKPLFESNQNIYLQWMSGGYDQERGNTSIFFELTEQNYNTFIKKSIKDVGPKFIANAPNYKKLDAFIKSKLGDEKLYCSVFFSYSEGSFVLDSYYGTTEDDLIPNNQDNIEKGNFFIQVASPKDKDAITFGAIKDDDVYVYDYNDDHTIKNVRYRNLKTDGPFAPKED